MKRLLILLALAVLFSFAATATLAAIEPPAADPFGNSPAVRKIVMFEFGLDSRVARGLLLRHGAANIEALPLIGGAVVSLPDEAAARALAHETAVLSVEDDIIVHALAKPTTTTTTPPPEQIPWGISKIMAPTVWDRGDTGDLIKVGIIDTGIGAHPDLVVVGGVSCVNYTRKYTDDNGHGTHVAGIVAAVDNAYGVVGAAPAADLYAIKVLDRKGSGYLSDIIEGLNWAVENGMRVVNMSLGTNSYSESFAAAIQNTAAAGVVLVAAAGNDGPGDNSVDYPGAFPEVIAVGATDVNDVIASWSSRGPQVAVAAPGVGVYSTYKGGTYATLSGTSMASPHVAGTVALMLESGVVADQVRTRLTESAKDLGPVGSDTAYGWGLVQADQAVAP